MTVNAGMVTKDAVTLVINGHTTPITDAHPNYSEIRSLVAAGKFASVASLLDVAASITNAGRGLVTVKDGVVMYQGEATHNAVTSRILAMVEEGLDVDPMIKFLENLMENPSHRSVQQLYGFLEVNDLPITEDGYFLAYKMVDRMNDGKLTDHRTHTFDYSVGAEPARMRRNLVDEDPNNTCSSGLHVCAQGYLGQYYGGGTTILVKVNPRDVVAVPTDYNNAKMRVCEHATVCEVKPDTRGNIFTSAVYKPVDTVVADDKTVVSVEDAMAHFGCSRDALRKRLNRGASAKRVYSNGIEMVQILDGSDPVAEKKDDTVSFAEAMKTLGIDRAALRKRLNRGATVEWAFGNDGEERVRFLTDEE